jgi:hypothetical protein
MGCLLEFLHGLQKLKNLVGCGLHNASMIGCPHTISVPLPSPDL